MPVTVCRTAFYKHLNTINANIRLFAKLQAIITYEETPYPAVDILCIGRICPKAANTDR